MLNKTLLLGLNIFILVCLPAAAFAESKDQVDDQTKEQCAELYRQLVALEPKYHTAFNNSDYKGVMQLKTQRIQIKNQIAALCQGTKITGTGTTGTDTTGTGDDLMQRSCDSLKGVRDDLNKRLKGFKPGDQNYGERKLEIYKDMEAGLQEQLDLLLSDTWYERSNLSRTVRVVNELSNQILSLAGLVDPKIAALGKASSYLQYFVSELRGMASNEDRLSTGTSAAQDILDAAEAVPKPPSPPTGIPVADVLGAAGSMIGSISNVYNDHTDRNDLRKDVDGYAQKIRDEIERTRKKIEKQKNINSEVDKIKQLSADITKKCP